MHIVSYTFHPSSPPSLCRAAMDRTVPAGGQATLSEQLAPVYETKNMVASQTQIIENMMAELRVRVEYYGYVLICTVCTYIINNKIHF